MFRFFTRSSPADLHGAPSDSQDYEEWKHERVGNMVHRISSASILEDVIHAAEMLTLMLRHRLDCAIDARDYLEDLIEVLEGNQDHVSRLGGNASFKSVQVAILEIIIAFLSPGEEDDFKTAERKIKERQIMDENCEMFLQDSKVLSEVLNLLDEANLSIRLFTIQILRILLNSESRIERVQNILLGQSMAVNKLCELLNENREVLRNGKRIYDCMTLKFRANRFHRNPAFAGYDLCRKSNDPADSGL